MLRMVSLDGSEITRRRVPKSELNYPKPINEKVDEIIDCFVAARLFTTGTDAEGQEYVEPVHDALVTKWEKPISKSETQENLLLQRRLTPAAEEWNDLNVNLKSSNRTNKIKAVINWLRSLKRLSPNEFQRFRDKPEQYLWNANPYLNVLNEVLNSSDNNWLNQVEADFVVQSIAKKRHNTIVRWSLAGSVILGSVVFSAAIWLQLQQTQLRQKAAEAENLLSTVPLEGLVLAIQTTGKNLALSKLPFQKILNPVQSSLISAVQEAREENVLLGHTEKVSAVAFSPDGNYIVTGSFDNTLRLWDREGNPIGQPFEGHQAEIDTVNFSPNSKSIVSGSRDGTVRLWNLEGQQIGKFFQGHKSSVYAIAFSPNGKSIISYGADNAMRWWNFKGEPIGEPLPLQGLKYASNTVAFSPDGRYIVSATNEDDLQLWNTNGQSIGKPFKGHEHYVLSVTFSPDSQYIVSGGADNTLRLWNIGNKLNPPQVGETFRGHENQISSVAFSPNGQYIASGSQDKTVILWNLEDKDYCEVLEYDSEVTSVAFSPDKKYIASGSKDKTVILWSLQDKSNSEVLLEHDSEVNSVAFSPNGKYIASGSADGTVWLWNIKGKTITGESFEAHEHGANSIAFSPNSKHIISGSASHACVGNQVVDNKSNVLKLWNLKGQQVGETFRGHEDSITSVAFNADGNFIISGSEDSTIRLWDRQGNPVAIFPQAHRNVGSVSFSPDGKHIISSGGETIRLWRGVYWQSWLDAACQRLHNHPVLKTPETNVAKGARETCEKYVWNRLNELGSNEATPVATPTSTSAPNTFASDTSIECIPVL